MRLLPTALVMVSVAILYTPEMARAQATAPAKAKPSAATPADAPGAAADESTLYALGVAVAANLKQFDLSPKELETVKKGMTDSVTGAKLTGFDSSTADAKIEKLGEARTARLARANNEAAKAYLAKAAAEKGAQKSPSGLIYRSVKDGTGPTPKAKETAKVNYEARLIDGTVVDGSAKNKEPGAIQVGQAIPCLNEGIMKMNVGGKAVLVCPSSIAYGEQGRLPSVPPGSTVIFEMELLDTGKAAPSASPHGGAAPGGAPKGHPGGMPSGMPLQKPPAGPPAASAPN